MTVTLAIRREVWPIRGTFAISRGARTEAEVVVAELRDGDRVGRGECVPYGRYGETPDSVVAEVERARSGIEGDLTRDELAALLPAGAARNVIDCASWDLDAKRRGRPAWRIAGLSTPEPLVTAFTISLDTPDNMAAAARDNAWRPLLKLKLGGEGDVERVGAVRAAAPDARLIVDANEAWSPDMVAPFGAALAALGVELIEQPLPTDDDAALAGMARPVPVCADESCRDTTSLRRLKGLYDTVNIKLDKTGGLTEALRLAAAARAQSFGVMVGCMVGTSLAVAPAILVGGFADYVDLDGPLLLARDREPGIAFTGSLMQPPPPDLWG